MSAVTMCLVVWTVMIPSQKPTPVPTTPTVISTLRDLPTTSSKGHESTASESPSKGKESFNTKSGSGNSTQANGGKSVAVGSITQGPCSVLQAGGNNNQATGGNCEPQERHLLKEQCDAIQQELRGKNLTLKIGSLIGATDAYDYAWEFLKCLDAAGVRLEPDRVMYMGIHGPLFTGIEVSVRGTPPQSTTTQWVDKRSPQGMVIQALVNAHFDQQITTGMSPDYPEGVVAIVVGKPPTSSRPSSPQSSQP